MKHNTLFATVACPIVLILASCESMHQSNSPAPLDSGLLQYADDAEKLAIEDARLAVVRANDRVRAAKLKLKDAQQAFNVAGEQVDVAQERVDVAQARLNGAERSQVAEKVDAALSDATAGVESARGRQALYSSLIGVRELQVELEESRVVAAQAKAEWEKAKALEDVNRVELADLDPMTFGTAYRAAKTEVAVVETRFRAAIDQLNVERDSYDGEEASFPEMQVELDSLEEVLESE